MFRGDMTIAFLFVVAMGWLAWRSRKAGGEGWIFAAIGAVVATAVALDEGYYWSIFAAANSYPRDDWRFMGLTRNELAAIIILGAGFFAPWLYQRFGATPNIRTKAPQCSIHIWPKSAFATVYVRNIAEIPLEVHRVAVVGRDGHLFEIVSCETAEHIVGNSAYFARTQYRPFEEFTAEMRAESWLGAADCWVHGEYQNGIAWSAKCQIEMHKI